MVRITALMDNQPSEHKALINEHGLSYLIEGRGVRLLFDCGSGEHPWYNAHRLGRSLMGLDAVALSHSHYDHAAGYRDLLERGTDCRILYTGPHFFEPKYAFDGVKYTDLSAGFDAGFLSEHNVEHRVVEDVREVGPGMYLVSGFPRTHDFETIPDRFVRHTPQGFVPDDFADEQCMVLETGDQVVVLVGCSHPGILNMIDRVHAHFQKPVYGVFGGTHLVEADEARIQTTVDRLQALGLEVLGLSHCSGEAAQCAIARRADVRGCHMGTGDCIFFDDPPGAYETGMIPDMGRRRAEGPVPAWCDSLLDATAQREAEQLEALGQKLSVFSADERQALLATARAYYEMDRSVGRAAQAMFIHKNTLQYRVRRLLEALELTRCSPFQQEYLVRLLLEAQPG